MISELLLKSGEPSLDKDKRSKVQSCHQVTVKMYEYTYIKLES